jgi:hypothetical protein
MGDEPIFAAALGKALGAERRAFLDEACGGDERPSTPGTAVFDRNS